jgi:hypothetical protein
VKSTHVSFPKESAQPIREIGEMLRDQIQVRERIVYGYVSSLERDTDDIEGTVTVRALVDAISSGQSDTA